MDVDADATNLAAASAIPPALPPSVEEAYRRKCIQLKQRTSEVEDANDAARLRLDRLKRQIEKMRLERAFLLEQLARRTSTNVEDSDGSPSPPPTPKEKPLRIKRGHRKPSLLTSLDAPATTGATFISQNLHGGPGSPGSDAFSSQMMMSHKTNGMTGRTDEYDLLRRLPPPTRPAGSAFELYCDGARAELREKLGGDVRGGEEEHQFEDELARSWKEDLTEDQRVDFEKRQERAAQQYREDKDAYDASRKAADEEDAAASADKRASVSAADTRRSSGRAGQDEDVEMGNYDTDQETHGEKLEE